MWMMMRPAIGHRSVSPPAFPVTSTTQGAPPSRRVGPGPRPSGRGKRTARSGPRLHHRGVPLFKPLTKAPGRGKHITGLAPFPEGGNLACYGDAVLRFLCHDCGHVCPNHTTALPSDDSPPLFFLFYVTFTPLPTLLPERPFLIIWRFLRFPHKCIWKSVLLVSTVAYFYIRTVSDPSTSATRGREQS